MKKFVVSLIFSILMIFSLSEIIFAEVDEKEQRAKEVAEVDEKEQRAKEVAEATENYKRKIIQKNIEEKEEVKEEPKIKKIPSKLIKLLPAENILEEITYRTIWKYVDKSSTLDEEVGIETTTAILRDITRVYDPIVNKYKVPTILIEIIKYDDIYELEYYWDEISSTTMEGMFHNSYLIGSPNENVNCMFNYSAEGGITLCMTDEYIVQSIIYDKYQEHFSYNKLKIGPKKLEINQDEMTTRIVQEILKNIEKNKDVEVDYELFKILKSNKEIKEKEVKDKQKHDKIKGENQIQNKKENSMKEEQSKNKLLGMEKDKKYGIQNFSCIKDEFGLITISGQFNNNEIKKDKVVLEILFLDYEQNIIFKNNANLLEIDEFETKRFLGNTKINKPFLTCTIQMNN
tara:strand:- start:1126 stop:2331 length:1206 start_codon:yes stop_codon:yes gene_type:complete